MGKNWEKSCGELETRSLGRDPGSRQVESIGGVELVWFWGFRTGKGVPAVNVVPTGRDKIGRHLGACLGTRGRIVGAPLCKTSATGSRTLQMEKKKWGVLRGTGRVKMKKFKRPGAEGGSDGPNAEGRSRSRMMEGWALPEEPGCMGK